MLGLMSPLSWVCAWGGVPELLDRNAVRVGGLLSHPAGSGGTSSRPMVTWALISGHCCPAVCP